MYNDIMYNIFIICEHLLVNANNAKIIVCCPGEHHWCYERDRNCFGEDEKGNLVDKNSLSIIVLVLFRCVFGNSDISRKKIPYKTRNFCFSNQRRGL